MKRLQLLFAAALSLASVAARADTLLTLDGTVYDGDARLLPSGDVLIAQRIGTPVQVPLANLLYATLNAPQPRIANTADTGPLTPNVVGEGDPGGDAIYIRGMFSIAGGGKGIGGSADGFRFLTRSLRGNGDISVRVDEITGADAVAGLMFRDLTDADSIQVSVLINAKGEMVLRYRADPAQKSGEIAAGKVTFPIYFMLRRTSRQFFVRTSNDGKTWKDAARLYDDDQPVPSNARPQGITMDTGAIVGLVLAGGTDAGPAGRARAIFERFEYQTVYDSPAPPVKNIPAAQYAGASPELQKAGLLLRTGTFLSGATIESHTGETLQLKFADQSLSVAAADLAVARLHDMPTSPLTGARAAVTALRPDGSSGILLASGDFMDGDITRFDKDQVEVSNVTLGLSTYRLDNKVTAVYFRDANTTPSGYRIRLRDGTIVVARTMTLDGKDAVLADYLVGTVRVPVADIVAIQGAADRATPLAAQTPDVKGPNGAVVESVSAADASAGLWLATAAQGFEQGLVVPAGASATYKLPAGAKQLLASVAVPMRLPAAAKVVFVAKADGKEIFRSAELSSRNAPAFVKVPLTGAKSLTLSVEAAGKVDMPTFGVWGNAMVIR